MLKENTLLPLNLGRSINRKSVAGLFRYYFGDQPLSFFWLFIDRSFTESAKGEKLRILMIDDFRSCFHSLEMLEFGGGMLNWNTGMTKT